MMDFLRRLRPILPHGLAVRILPPVVLATLVIITLALAGQGQDQKDQQPGQPLGQPIGQPLGQPMGQPLGKPLGQPLGQQIGQTIGEPMGQPLGETLGQQIGTTIGTPLGSQIGTPLGTQIGSSLGPPPGVAIPFEGEWTASGTRQVLDMGPGRQAVSFNLSGSLILTSQAGLKRGFQSQAVGSGDGKGQMTGSCTWTDDEGDQIFSDIKGEAVGSGKHVQGAITGGTGRFDGLTGGYEFDWQYVIQDEDGNVQGRAVGLKGIAEKSKVW